jgi:quaternary ammonium compound-resistance protein SugE
VTAKRGRIKVQRLRIAAQIPISAPSRGDDPALVKFPAGTALPFSFKEGRMAWTILLLAGLLEIGWAIGLKYTDGFTRLWPSVWTLASMVGSIVLLGLALKWLPVGTAYAVWTGIGTIGVAILGIVLFSEPATAVRLGCIGLIIAGITGLKAVT